MAHAPRPAAPLAGSAAGPGSSQTGARAKEGAGSQGTFFLGRYRVVDEIGVGGMASVHLGRMDGPGGFQKWVAIKRIHPHLVEDDQFVDMFLDEARIAAGINHANVAQVFDLGKDDNTYWIAMEYLHGEPLREIMRRAEEHHALVSPDLAARICSDSAEGLHAAHELRGKNGQLLGLVHRDVTPHNLFITYDGYTKVVDFGIAKVADRLSQTRAGTLKGKLAYMSPEQVRGAEVDRTTDIFALGVVLWELTTNQRLFRMDTDLDTLEKVQACVVPPPSTIVPDYPVELESVVMKALAKRKQDRFQTAREFSRALQNFLMRRGAFVGPEEVAQFVRQVFSDRIQKREAHLAWAAEVTSTINVDALRAGKASLPGSAEDLSLVSYSDRDPLAMTGGPLLAAGRAQVATARPVSAPRVEAQMAATSLMDDDEDVPTAVATRAHVEEADRALRTRGVPPPPAPSQATVRPGFGAANYGASSKEERTAALPSPLDADDAGLGATIALPQAPSSSERRPQSVIRPVEQPRPDSAPRPQAPRPPSGQAYAPPQGQAYGPPQGQAYAQQGPPQPQGRAQSQPGGYPPAPKPFNSGPAFGQPPAGYGQAPAFGQPPAGFGQAPADFGQAPGFGQGYAQPSESGRPQPKTLQLAAMPLPAGRQMPQSQVETALSLPRPDPNALWLAQQDATGARSQRRNTGVLLAVVLLTALCVGGIFAFVWLKLRASEQQVTVAEAAPSASALASAAVSAAASAAELAAPPAVASAEVARPVESAAAPVAKPPVQAPPPGGKTPPPPAAPAPADGRKDEPGFLTIVCAPFCDDVVDQSKSLGPSPVVRVPVAPGQHRITLKRAGQANKVISVIVVSGQVTAQRVSMK